MKRSLIIVLIMLVSLAAFAQRQRTTATQTEEKTTTTTTQTTQKTEPAAEVIKGSIVSLKGLVLGTDGKVSKEEALKLAQKGDPVVFLHNGKVYFPFHENGAFAYEKVAELANRTNVGIVGKLQTKNGVNSVIVSRIVSLD
jgi:hypothetical protein